MHALALQRVILWCYFIIFDLGIIPIHFCGTGIEHNNNMLRVTSLLRFSYLFEGVVGNLRGTHNRHCCANLVPLCMHM